MKFCVVEKFVHCVDSGNWVSTHLSGVSFLTHNLKPNIGNISDSHTSSKLLSGLLQSLSGSVSWRIGLSQQLRRVVGEFRLARALKEPVDALLVLDDLGAMWSIALAHCDELVGTQRRITRRTRTVHEGNSFVDAKRLSERDCTFSQVSFESSALAGVSS